MFVGIRVENYSPMSCLFSIKSLFNLVADKFISTTEKKETSSAKSLVFVVRSSERSLI